MMWVRDWDLWNVCLHYPDKETTVLIKREEKQSIVLIYFCINRVELKLGLSCWIIKAENARQKKKKKFSIINISSKISHF